MNAGPARGTVATRPGSPEVGASALRLALPVGATIDPFALAGPTGVFLADRGRVLVGLGVALTLELPDGLAAEHGLDAALTALAAVPCDDRLAGGTTGHAVLAFAALPFDRHESAVLTVPELLYCREADGSEWVTLVARGGDLLPDPLDPATAASLRSALVERTDHTPGDPSPDGVVQVVPRTSDADFLSSVSAAVGAIGRGDLVKVVLARTVDVRLGGAVDVPELLRRWTSLEPGCTIFSMPTDDGRFVGASPELLVERTGDRVRSRPLAGTTDRGQDTGSGLPDELLESAKDGEEHRLVVDAIRAALEPVTSRLTVPDRPELVHLHNLTHLGTEVEGTLRPGPDGPPSALHLASRLHPTPAVGGVPLDAATALQHRLEPVRRGTYAGPVGYVDASGDGRFVVGIRALTVEGRNVRMTAGVGIVSDSRPETELEETGLKLTAVFDALAPGVRPATPGGVDPFRPAQAGPARRP